jgi:hypothetical protein
LLATGSDDLHICLWDLQSSRPIVGHNTGHTANIFCVKFLPTTGGSRTVNVLHCLQMCAACSCQLPLLSPTAVLNLRMQACCSAISTALLIPSQFSQTLAMNM